MTAAGRAWTAVAALAAIGVITASWWALALWPVGDTAPAWLLRTREVCFGSTADTLPNAGGWILLIGQPVGMVALLAAIWGRELGDGLSMAMARASGQLAVGVAAALVAAGLWSVTVRVRTAELEPFSPGRAADAAALTRVDDAAPALSLVDQTGARVALADFRGRPVVVAFAYAHCETVCPQIVSDVLTARRRLDGDAPGVLIVTLDPWRDTPARLASIAKLWGLEGDAHVLSGAPEEVERALNAWRVPRVRNQKTGEISHPAIVYVVGPTGRITYVVDGNPDAIAAAVRAL
jgi:protein SCO1/2